MARKPVSRGISPRDVLLKKTGRTRGRSAWKWLQEHPQAKKFVDEWVKMKVAGETDWLAIDVMAHLRDHFEFPFTAESMFNRMLLRNYAELRPE